MVLLNYLSMQNYANKMLFFEYKWLVQISNSLIGHSKNMQNTRTSAT